MFTIKIRHKSGIVNSRKWERKINVSSYAMTDSEDRLKRVKPHVHRKLSGGESVIRSETLDAFIRKLIEAHGAHIRV